MYFRRGEEPPLWSRINQLLGPFKSRPGPMLSLISQLDELVASLKFLDTGKRPDEQDVREAVQTIVRRCADVSYGGKHRSLEEQLRRIPGGREVSELRELSQIDKLARYLGLSRDLAKLAQRPGYRHVTRNIALEFLTAFHAEIPAGVSQKCYVHAEVQLILHYEQGSLEKPPRAIGCSKSACFLCDSLIQRLGQYRISHAHRRLYNLWTIPNVSLKSTERVRYFRSVLEKMVLEMGSLAADARGARTNSRGQLFRPFGLESRAAFPLSSHSDLDVSTVPSTLASRLPAPRVSFAGVPLVHSIYGSTTSSSSLISVNLGHDDLPHQQPLSSNTASLYLRVDGLFLVFDCSSVSDGRLSICEIKKGAGSEEQDVQCIQVSDIPTTDMVLRHAKRSSPLKFRLQIAHGMTIEVEIDYKASREAPLGLDRSSP